VCVFHFNFDWNIFCATYTRNCTSVSDYTMNIQIYHLTVLVLPLLSTITKAAYISCCTLSFICELSYVVDYHFDVPAYINGVYLRTEWKNNSLHFLCVDPCSFHALVRKFSLNNVLSTYLQLHSLFHYPSFIVVLSPYIPGQRSGAYMYHEYITVTFCLEHQSRHWWEWIGLSAFPWKHWEYWVLLLTLILLM
jgi:hypothetical protein